MPIIFIGHSLQDTDIRATISDLSTNLASRPRYYLVTPATDEISIRFFESKKITTIIGTFNEFMKSLDSLVNPAFRILVERKDNEFHICEKFKTRSFSLSEDCKQFLLTEVDYVKTIVADRSAPK